MLVTGHRGASGTVPENTLGAFKRALELGADAIELDVHRTKDGQMVVIHDDTVNRTTNGRGAVAEMTFEQIRTLRTENGEQVPTLQEVFDLVAGKATIFVEIKSPGTDAVAPLIHGAVKKGQFIYAQLPVISFNHPLLGTLKQANPDILTGATFDKDDCKNMVARAEAIGASAINPHHSKADAATVEAAHKAGLAVNVWTVNEHDDIRRVIKAGVDAVMSDFPDRVKRVQQVDGNGRADAPSRHA